ncbi:MAG: hypothetical protein ABGZ17_13575, partial [Planctomycetaceae bacterium]
MINVNYSDYELVQTTGGNLLDDVINIATLADGEDTNPNNLTLQLDATGTLLEVLFDGDTTDGTPAVLLSTQLYSSVNTVTVNGGTDDDTLTVNHANGVINRELTYAGGGGAGTDNLVLTGDPGTLGAARETYLVGATEDAGTWVIDPDDSMGPGANGAPGGDEMIVNFSGLEPVDTDTPAAIFDVIMTAVVNEATIQDGGTLGGANALQLTDGNSTFETTRFANKTMVRIMGQEGSDELDVDFTTASAGLTTLEVYGHVATDVVGQPADDDVTDFLGLFSTDAITTNVLGQGGSDLIYSSTVTNTLDNLQGTINVTGGETVADRDILFLGASGDATADNATLTSTRLSGAAPATINYSEIEAFSYEATADNDTVDVLTTAVGTEYGVAGGSGDDTITIGNQTVDFNTVFDGSLDGILGEIGVTGEFDGSTAGTDTLNIDDSGTANLNAAASVNTQTARVFELLPSLGNIVGDATVLSGFAPAEIGYYHGAFAIGATPVANNALEFVNVITSTGDDTVAVNATTATTTTTIDLFTGNDANTLTINGDGLSGDNLFSGNTGTDNIVLNVTTNLGNTSVTDLTGLTIEGNDPNG